MIEVSEKEKRNMRLRHNLGTVHSPSGDPYVYPCLIRRARYQGTYSGGLWHAWPVRDTSQIPGEAYGSDVPCRQFWSEVERTGVPIVGQGPTPTAAHNDLVAIMQDEKLVFDNDDNPDLIDHEGLRPYIDE